MALSSILRRRCICGVLRGETPFIYFFLGCYAMFWRIWVFLQTLILSPAAIVERASLLTNGIRYGSISPRTSRAKGSPSTTKIRGIVDAPPAVPPTSEPPITIPGAEYRALLASFQTLTTTQTAIMERMDHFQLRQDQQTLILLPYYQEVSLPPFYYHLLLEHWGQCSSYLYWLGVTDLTARYMGGWVSYLMTLVDD
ncbi:hypothetical protein AAG906_025779 [Vitis piasezkii]